MTMARKNQKDTAQLCRILSDDRGETGADELFVSVVDDDVSWERGGLLHHIWGDY